MTSPRMRSLSDLYLLLARVGLGVILIAHGWQKLVTDGIDATAGQFDEWGVPLPEVAAYYATIVELVGGIAIMLGLTVRIVGLLVAADLLGAIAIVHLENGVFVTDGGFELALAIAALAIGLTVFGAGRISLDHLFGRSGKAATVGVSKAESTVAAAADAGSTGEDDSTEMASDDTAGATSSAAESSGGSKADDEAGSDDAGDSDEKVMSAKEGGKGSASDD